ncbi:choice-of-anchor A family protein [Spirosoma validum]|uniref:Choice-of-anchor A family protein n=1 Tax=Spirosoma validum TaxID=2771355 RepID=A0A927B7K4_9BACT|nr:choice-of-anchor A family protein [Spirosoma validum]MBD2757191.1 choice-of-anchor A family protein [Spirosoma validum]
MKTIKLFLSTIISSAYSEYIYTHTAKAKQSLSDKNAAQHTKSNYSLISLSSFTYSFSKIYRALVLVCFLSVGQFSQTLAQNPLALADKFNVFLANDATLSTNESDGPVAIGGNLTVAGYYQVATHGSSFMVNGYPVGLVVGKGVKLQSGILQVNSNTYAKIGACQGNTSSDVLKVWYQNDNNAYSTMRVTKSTAGYNSEPYIQINTNANSSTETNTPVCKDNIVAFASAFTTLKANSVSLSQKADNISLTNANGNPLDVTNMPGQVYVNLEYSINVWNIKGSDLNKIQTLTYSNDSNKKPSANRVLVINVDAAGTTFVWNTPNQGGMGNGTPYILWNFYNTTNLQIAGNSQISGSVLAPFADVVKTINQANIEGQLIANSLVHSGGEMHFFPFSGNIPTTSSITISGSVFNDSNGLTDGTVNGTPVNTLSGNTFSASLVGSDGKVKATTTLTNGTYAFTNVTPNASYSIVLSNYPAVVGSGPPSTTLTGGVINTGEHIGTGSGSDGTPDGVISVAVSTNSVTDVNFGVKTLPDLTPIIYARPSTIYGTTEITVVVDVVELNSIATNGLITVKVTRDAKISLSFPTNATSINNKTVQNTLWTCNSLDPTYYILTTTSVVPAGDKLSFGFTGTLTPGATTGVLTMSSVILGGSGGENRVNNNVDADKIDYFQQ